MGFNNPDMPWSELERRLSGGRPKRPLKVDTSDQTNKPMEGDGGDSPAWSRKRMPYMPPSVLSKQATIPYGELHCHSNFSFLDGASHPEELAEEAARLGLTSLAITDHDGLYGIVRFAEAATAVGLQTVFGAELSLGLTRPQNGVPDPEGRHLVVLARNQRGYARLSRVISEAQMRGKQKGKPVFFFDELASAHGGEWVVLTGCRKGVVPHALINGDERAAGYELQRLANVFGRENTFVELWDHGLPLDADRNDALAALATRNNIKTVATGNIHYATPARRHLATAIAAVRARRDLDGIDGWLPAAATAHLRSGAEMAAMFARYPTAIAQAHELGKECAFDIHLVAPNLPDCEVPNGHNEATWLRQLTYKGALRRYGERDKRKDAYKQIDHELQLIEQLNFPGYFLIVHDIVDFCRRSDIYCQGRGSAANSAVCYALGITNADAVGLKLLFERFLAPERDGPPDIDLDIESDRREEVIQYVYARYGRDRAAQVCNVVTYRPKSAVRDMAKAFGHSPGQQDAWSKQLDSWSPLKSDDENNIPANVMHYASELQNFPRHLGIHSGGMVLCDRPIVEVCPIEWARMENRSVLQWDKDDCAVVGLVKFDLLGLGMLSVLHYAVDMVREHHGIEVDLATIPQEDEVYEMLQRADSIGVFQVESRAQMATLPRLKPRVFYDLVVEVALIRPGPIQGGSVHPYIRRRNGREPVTYLHPLLERSLKKTLGVPLFQEQLMQMAIDIAGFSASDADQLRQAMGSKRSVEKMERLKERLYTGMAERGVTDDVANEIYDKLLAFANFGFPESHSVSFAYLVYSSSWLKYHYPECFLAALLKAQPMGFWSPQSLVADAQRHGVVVLGPSVNDSHAMTSVVRRGGATPSAGGATPSAGDGAVRLGIDYVRHIGLPVAERIANAKPYESMEEVVRAAELTLPQTEALATAGAFECLGVDRRSSLWTAGSVVQSKPGRLQGVVTGADAPRLEQMTEIEKTSADIWATGVTVTHSPVEFARPFLDARGAIPISELQEAEAESRVLIGGVVTHRQRPATAQGVTFLNLEDETGMANVVCSKGLWARHRRVARSAPAMIVRGKLERYDGVINIVADKLEALSLRGQGALKSRDFH